MIIVGLTGSIGMGKSTTAAMFAEEGIAVHDADQTVHHLYRGRAAPLVESAFPGTVTDGAVDRTKLAGLVLGDSAALKKLENIVHPLVRAEELAFLKQAEAKGAAMVVLDIPLLFETGGEKRVDKIVVATAPAEVQRERVLGRAGMSEEKFQAILAKQVPDAEKRERADFLVDTSEGLEGARSQVRAIIATLTRG